MERIPTWNTYDFSSKADICDDIHKYGRNPDVDSGTTPEDIWTVGGEYPWPVAAAVTSIVSTDPADNPAGAGVGSVTVEGLDSNWLLITETVDLDGVTPVVLANQYFRCFRVFAVTLGSTAPAAGGTNVGNINVTHPGPVTIAQVLAGVGQTLMALYTVPADYLGAVLMQSWLTYLRSGGAAGRADVSLQTRTNLGPWRVQRTVVASDTGGPWRLPEIIPIRYPPRTDIVLKVDGVTANDSDISGGFDMYLMKASY